MENEKVSSYVGLLAALLMTLVNFSMAPIFTLTYGSDLPATALGFRSRTATTVMLRVPNRVGWPPTPGGGPLHATNREARDRAEDRDTQQ